MNSSKIRSLYSSTMTSKAHFCYCSRWYRRCPNSLAIFCAFAQTQTAWLLSVGNLDFFSDTRWERFPWLLGSLHWWPLWTDHLRLVREAVACWGSDIVGNTNIPSPMLVVCIFHSSGPCCWECFLEGWCEYCLVPCLSAGLPHPSVDTRVFALWFRQRCKVSSLPDCKRKTWHTSQCCRTNCHNPDYSPCKVI